MYQLTEKKGEIPQTSHVGMPTQIEKSRRIKNPGNVGNTLKEGGPYETRKNSNNLPHVWERERGKIEWGN